MQRGQEVLGDVLQERGLGEGDLHDARRQRGLDDVRVVLQPRRLQVEDGDAQGGEGVAL